MSETGFDNTPRSAPEPLSGKETAEIVSSIYDAAGPRIGSYLVDSNCVLTLAGARGQTEFFIQNPTSEDKESIVKANDAVDAGGIHIRNVGTGLKDPKGQDMFMVTIGSLRGYERVSRLTKFPGIKPFDAASGWEGFSRWNMEAGKAIDLAQKDGLFPSSKGSDHDILAGIHKGYPDQAILDFCDWLSKNRKPKVITSEIPLADLYEGALPLFDFYPEHQNDPSIQSTIQTWNKVLEEFYSSPWHENIKTNQQFVHARQEIDKGKSQ